MRLLQKNQSSLAEMNAHLHTLSAPDRIAWMIQHLPGNHALSSSFGVQSAVMLHMATQVKADIPVILVDTGYLFPETYQFIDELTERLQLNLHIAQPTLSPAWFEARHGKLWEQGKSGLEQYNEERKVAPMRAALEAEKVNTWFSGIRHEQSETRADLDILTIKDGRYKAHPIIEWSSKDIHQYLKAHNLPYHPLWEEGYVSVGDTHSTVPLSQALDEQSTRFNGVQRECGLHL